MIVYPDRTTQDDDEIGLQWMGQRIDTRFDLLQSIFCVLQYGREIPEVLEREVAKDEGGF